MLFKKLIRGHPVKRGPSQVVLVAKNPPADAGDVGSIPGPGRSPGGGHGNPLQYCSLENRKDKGAHQAPVYRVAKSWTRLKQLGMHAARENIQEIEFIKNSKYVICTESRNSKRSSQWAHFRRKKNSLHRVRFNFQYSTRLHYVINDYSRIVLRIFPRDKGQTKS